MARCAGCGGNVRSARGIAEEISGRIVFFCCRGCRKLHEIRYVKPNLVEVNGA